MDFPYLQSTHLTENKTRYNPPGGPFVGPAYYPGQNSTMVTCSGELIDNTSTMKPYLIPFESTVCQFKRILEKALKKGQHDFRQVSPSQNIPDHFQAETKHSETVGNLAGLHQKY